MESKKHKFYIFLDFDGVLNDLKTIPAIFKLGGFFVNKKDTKVFNSESIYTLNSLISTLEHKYDVQLVLTTFWRKNPEKAREILYTNGLEYLGKIDSIPFISYQSRLSKIMDYIRKDELGENYLIIDDKPKITKYIIEKNLIKTNLINGALNISQALNYIDTHHPDLSKYFPLGDFDFERNQD